MTVSSKALPKPISIGPAIRRCLLPAAIFVVLMGVFFLEYDPYQDVGPDLLPGGSFEAAPGGASPLSPGGAWNARWNYLSWEPEGGHEGAGVELKAEQGHGGFLEFVVTEPRRYEYLRLSGWVRTENVIQGKRPWNIARILLFFRDAENKPHWNHPHDVCSYTGTRGWTFCEKAVEVPEFAVTGHVYVQNAAESGRMWIDDLELHPARSRTLYPWWRGLFGTLWGISALYCAATLQLWRRPLGWPILLTAVVIIGGLTLPGGVVEKAAEEQIFFVDTVRNALPDISAPAGSPAPATAGKQESSPAAAKVTPTAPPKSPRVSPKRLKGYLSWIKHRSHQFLFALLSYLVALSLARGMALSPRRRRQALGAAAAGLAGLLLFAAATEILQFVSLTRGPSMEDWITDGGGVLLGLLAGVLTVLLVGRWLGLRYHSCP